MVKAICADCIEADIAENVERQFIVVVDLLGEFQVVRGDRDDSSACG